MYNNRVSPDPDPPQPSSRTGSADKIRSPTFSFTAGGENEQKTETGQGSLGSQGQLQNESEQKQDSEVSEHSVEVLGGNVSQENVEGGSLEQEQEPATNNLNLDDPGHHDDPEAEKSPGSPDFGDDKIALIIPDESRIYDDKKSDSETPKPSLAHEHSNQHPETFEMELAAIGSQRKSKKKSYPQAEEKKTYHRTEEKKQYNEIEKKRLYHEVIIGSGGEEGEGEIGCCGWVLTILSVIIVILTVPFSMFFCIKVVQEYERAVIFRLGRLLTGGAKGPGIFFILPCIESYTKVDLRTVSFDVPPQEILTRDSVTVSVDAVVYYRVSNPTVSVANVENAHHATRLLAQTTLRNILGTKNMSEILTERETISNAMQNVLDGATDRWGIKVERVEIKDVRLPLQLQRAMAAEAEASREARAKVLAAEGEHQASRSLKEAADTIAQSPAAIQLRYLQTLNSISAEKNSTIIFPLPIDLIKSFMGGDVSRKSNSKSSTIM